MAELSPHKVALLKRLVSASPDELVRGLEQALCSETATGPLAAVGALIEAEAADRAVRFAVLAPVAVLFGPAVDDGRPRFPRVALGAIWQGLKAEAPELVREAASAFHYIEPDAASPEVFDLLCARAADGLASRETPEFAAAAAACEADRAGGAAELEFCLRLAPVARPPILRLGDWIQRMTDERRVTARLAYRDATALGEGGGPMFFEMLAGHLNPPALVLRVISAVMDHPAERYLAGSELARFGERVLTEVEAQLTQLRAMKPGASVESGREAGVAVQRAIERISELEQAVQLSKDGPWGQRLSKLKQGIAGVVESRLRDIDEASQHALPTQKLRYSAKLTRTAPKISDPPNEQAVGWALGLLAFAEAIRTCATDGGFGSVRSKVLDNLSKRIDQYVEDMLEQLRLGDIEDGLEDRAREFLAIAADMLTLARDEQSGSIVRRRAAAA
ncbi:MAG: hypothetical protein ACOY4K_15415 [Pseudomonadota bacterium]